MIKEYVFKKIIDVGFSKVKDLLKNNEDQLLVKKANLQDSLHLHSKYIENWSSSITFKDLAGPKKLNNVFIELDIHLTPRKLMPKGKKNKNITITEIFEKDEHAIFLGDPGAGKTTTLKKICQGLIHTSDQYLGLNFPILIILRELDIDESIFDKLSKITGIYIQFNKASISREERISYLSLIRSSLLTYLDSLNCLLLIDGLDEVHPNKLPEVIKDLRELFLTLQNSKIVLTCRSGFFDLNIENSTEYEICPLTKIKIIQFVKRWFNDSKTEKKFLTSLNKSPFHDTSVRPLTLAHLCALYDKYKEIPEKPKTIYKKIILLLLEEWDSQRVITRESHYANFTADRKMEFLSHFAFLLTVTYYSKTYNEEQLKIIYKKICGNYNLPSNEVLNVIKEIEAHCGLFCKTHYEGFEFSHKSLQEYLAAEHIVRMPKIPKKDLYDTNIYNELAIAVCLSSSPTFYLAHLVFEDFEGEKIKTSNIEEFLSRLRLEKPDFIISSIIPLIFYHIFNKYYLIEDGKYENLSTYLYDEKPDFPEEEFFDEYVASSLEGTNELETETELAVKPSYNTYVKLFNCFCSFPNVKKSFSSFNKIIVRKEKLNNGFFKIVIDDKAIDDFSEIDSQKIPKSYIINKIIKPF